MFPLGDDNSDRVITPYVNYAIIGLNILVFVLLQHLAQTMLSITLLRLCRKRSRPALTSAECKA